jgi:hypothetical protein
VANGQVGPLRHDVLRADPKPPCKADLRRAIEQRGTTGIKPHDRGPTAGLSHGARAPIPGLLGRSPGPHNTWPRYPKSKRHPLRPPSGARRPTPYESMPVRSTGFIA